jgi:hypothetical protein
MTLAGSLSLSLKLTGSLQRQAMRRVLLRLATRAGNCNILSKRLQTATPRGTQGDAPATPRPAPCIPRAPQHGTHTRVSVTNTCCARSRGAPLGLSPPFCLGLSLGHNPRTSSPASTTARHSAWTARPAKRPRNAQTSPSTRPRVTRPQPISRPLDASPVLPGVVCAAAPVLRQSTTLPATGS